MHRAIAFAIAFIVPFYYALRGGSYDVLSRHEEALVIWLLLEAGLATGVLPRSRMSRMARVALVGIGAFALLTLLSLSWTESNGRTFEELTRVLHYGGLILLALLGLNRYTFRAAAGGLVAAGIAVCALADASWLAPSAIEDQVGRLASVHRLSYPLDYWNATGAWAAMSMAGALAFSAHSRVPAVRAATLAALPIAGLAVYLSFSRAGVAGACVGVFLVLVLSRNRWTAIAHTIVAGAAIGIVILITRDQPEIAQGTGDAGAGLVAAALLAAGAISAAVASATSSAGMDRMRMPRQSARFAMVCAAIGVVLVAATAGQGPISDAWDEFQNDTGPTTTDDTAARLTSFGSTRSDVWDSAFDAYAAEPLTGIGPGTFEFWWSRNTKNGEFARDAHSLYFEQLAELGLPGLLLILAFLGALVGAGVRARVKARRGVDAGASAAMLSMAGVYLVQAGLDWMWEVTAVTAMGLGAAAIAASGASERRRGPLHPYVRLGLVAACLLAALTQVPGLVSTARNDESQSALEAGDLDDAAEAATEAVDAQPWATEPYMQRAAVAEAQGNYGLARDDLNEAIEREPTNWRPRILLAQVELLDGDEEAAEAAFDEAHRLHPFSTLFATFPLFRSQILGTPPPAPESP